MSQYRSKQWKAFRQQVIDFYEGTCLRCGKTAANGTVMQVHHKFGYDKKRLIHDYKMDEVELNCRRCHAETHGKVRPLEGWVCVGEDDLGDLTGKCDICETQLRYEFFIEHDNWPPLTVGTNCCDNLTGTKEASLKQKEMQKLAKFCDSSRWKNSKRGIMSIYKRIFIEIFQSEKAIKIAINEIEGKMSFESFDLAKRHAFKIITVGKYKNWVNRRTR